MVLIPGLRIACLFLLAAIIFAAPAAAHERHNENRAAEQPVENSAGAIAEHATNRSASTHSMTMADRPPASFGSRLVAFVGRMHPFAVHFPIALFPIAWLALIFARRRGDRVDLIRAFIVVAGITATVAGALGWLNAGLQLADRDPIQSVHRWLGTALALIGAALALWAWRRADAVSSRGMIWSLGGVTGILLIQGWLGAAITHGVEHMMF